ncbi:AP-1 complex subunit mu-1 [Anabarilius grahami]|uniref:AP-1 complex subunit mu-1 n=1 Tax=Anabarilius grahami TaxID=495550 RepID=A0A3N0YZ06_ANAGA|nr:AP-1 complex subunit mu-1 [Anabarilius grahami]
MELEEAKKKIKTGELTLSKFGGKSEVRYLKIIEKSGYQALPWVRYITQNGGKRLSHPFSYSLSLFLSLFFTALQVFGNN